MNCIIPFTQDIKFNTNISEVLSISLEHDYTLNDNELLGNFTVSGDYKSHEVSVNKENFLQVLPFSVSLTDRIAPDSLEFNIEDFTYEILNNNTLRVNIEYSVKGDTSLEEPITDEVIFERLDDEEDVSLEELLEQCDEENQELEETKEKEEIEEIEEVEEQVREEMNVDQMIEEVKHEEKVVEEATSPEEEKMIEERIPVESEETIISSIASEDDNAFVTYHIHILKENETIETVCSLYNTSQQLLGEYNDLEALSVGGKIIIPEENE